MHHYSVTCPNCAAEFLPGQAVTTRLRPAVRWWHPYSHVSEVRCPKCQAPLRFSGWLPLFVAATLLAIVGTVGESLLKPTPVAYIVFLVCIIGLVPVVFRYVTRKFLRANHRDA